MDHDTVQYNVAVYEQNQNNEDCQCNDNVKKVSSITFGTDIFESRLRKSMKKRS